MKAASIIVLLLAAPWVQASDMASCNGTVLQRRLALVELGRLADAYIAVKNQLPDICAAPVTGVSDAIPNLLRGASVCGSSREGFVYYSCQIPSAPAESSPVVESCRYSLANQSVSCENRSVVTTFDTDERAERN
ncbi:MAG: hypothetical protein NVV73_05435 [Cellvibrionaceae bacterium]|nr:hypothetical protein [Cellvibrionaceae bacterium]